MMLSQKAALVAALSVIVFTAGCKQTINNANATPENSIVFLNITSDFNEDPQAVDMALKLAGFALEEKRSVAIFFNVKGVLLPVKDKHDDFKFEENDPLITQLKQLIKDGADVHVCPICMKALNVEKSQLIEGAKETTRPDLFSKIGSNTAVFTY